LTPIWLSALAGVVVLAVFVAFLASLTTTTVIVVRHAEKELGTIEDPPLSQAGEQRAQLLARMFGEREGQGRIAAIFTSDTRRAQRTAAPLAARLGLELTVVPANDLDTLVRRIRGNFRGRTVLVVGHSNTVPELVAKLARLEHIEPIADEEYDRMYIVTVPTLGKASVLRMAY